MEQLDNLRSVRQFVGYCRRLAEDADKTLFHHAERSAWVIALRAIANGDDRAVELAKAALETEGIRFVEAKE